MTTILVVDDSAVDRRFVGELLRKESDWVVDAAENGSAALTKMRTALPDVVVTDLQMPVMDGLELVAAVRAQHPDVPVILMTAHGSEALAVEALRAGAAGYVAKAQVAEALVETVQQVLSLGQADRSHRRLLESICEADFRWSLENDPALIGAAVDFIQQIVEGVGLCDSVGRLRVGAAMEQALRNALYRGNLEIGFEQMQQARERLLEGKGLCLVEERRAEPPFCERRIFLDARINAQEARFVVRDEGPGFDVRALPAVDHPSALEGGGGRGLVLMRTFMDEVIYNDRGNEVTMIKRRPSG